MPEMGHLSFVARTGFLLSVFRPDKGVGPLCQRATGLRTISPCRWSVGEPRPGDSPGLFLLSGPELLLEREGFVYSWMLFSVQGRPGAQWC